MTNLKERLKEQEEFKAEPYRDASGWSIGFGHFLGNGQACKISRGVADLILDEDIHKATFEYLSLGWDYLSQNRQDVCREMIFWHGLKGFLRFKKCIAAIEKQDWEKAANELMDSMSGRNYAIRMQGLAELMRNG